MGHRRYRCSHGWWPDYRVAAEQRASSIFAADIATNADRRDALANRVGTDTGAVRGCALSSRSTYVASACRDRSERTTTTRRWLRLVRREPHECPMECWKGVAEESARDCFGYGG